MVRSRNVVCGHSLKFGEKSDKPVNKAGADGGGTTPIKQTVCFKCDKPGHISKYCPNQKKSGTTQQASSKRVVVVEQDSVTHLTQGQPSKVDHSTSTELDFTEQTPSDGVENIHASTCLLYTSPSPRD